MLKRSGKFLGCVGYPKCKYTFDITRTKVVISPKLTNLLNEKKFEKPLICPECGKLLKVLF